MQLGSNPSLPEKDSAPFDRSNISALEDLQGQPPHRTQTIRLSRRQAARLCRPWAQQHLANEL